MKPLQLDLHAFGPFARHQVVDFRQLGDKTFFLIHGATGAGKTSILDGMCFALFGDSSGGEREGRQMRSHHADDTTLTQAGFRFALGDATYHVLRVPEQVRRSARTGRETKQLLKAELSRIEVVDGLETAQPLASGWSKVTQAIVDLLGFESSQFRQVLLLPQGRFFEFLKSTSAEREKILQALFGTELYKRIELQLKESAGALAKQADGVRMQRQALLAQGGVADEAALAERQRAQADELVRRQGAESNAALAATQAEAALADAQRVAERFQELDQAGIALKSLDDRREAAAAEKAALDAGRRAALIEPHAAALAALDERIAEAGREAQRLAARDAEATEAMVRAEASRVREQARSPEIDAATTRLAELDAFVARVAALADVRRQHVAAQAEAAKTGRDAQAAREIHRAAVEAAKAQTLRLQDARVQAAGLDGARARARQVAMQLAQATTLAGRLADLAKAERTQAAAQARDHASELASRRADTRRDGLRHAWVAGLAMRLAHALAEGAPCPVCGSLDHPQAAATRAEPVDDEAMEAAEAAVRSAGEARLEAARGLAEARQAAGVLQAQVADLKAAVGDAPRGMAELQAEVKTADAATSAAEAASASIEALVSSQAEAQRAVEASERAAQAADAAANAAQARLLSTGDLVVERQAGIPPALAEPAALDAERGRVVALRDGLRQAQRAADDAVRQAGLVATESRTRVQAHAVESQLRVERRAAQAADVARRLAEAGFADAAVFRAAQVDEASLARRQASLDAFNASLAAARDRQARAALQTQDIVRPDLDALTAAHEAAKTQRLAASNAVRDALAESKATGSLAGSLARLAEDFQAVELRYGAIKRVAEVAAGDNAQRMSFQRYVLATLLEEVLAATSVRLQAMSRGRYEIRRSLQAANQRSAAGLDLEVFDQYTGTTRAVNTLSGGESFLASLSLALGLSDVVQSHAGGVRLDAIFVDEGFGTLDPESLDIAIRALQDLQQAGRMVGIISHVAELREWVDARLEVKATQRGSVAAFRL